MKFDPKLNADGEWRAKTLLIVSWAFQQLDFCVCGLVSDHLSSSCVNNYRTEGLIFLDSLQSGILWNCDILWNLRQDSSSIFVRVTNLVQSIKIWPLGKMPLGFTTSGESCLEIVRMKDVYKTTELYGRYWMCIGVSVLVWNVFWQRYCVVENLWATNGLESW